MQEERNGMPGTDDTGGDTGDSLRPTGIPGTRYATSGWRTATW